MNEKNLAFAREFFFHHALHESFAERRDGGLNREAILRRRFDHTHITQTNERHVQSARNGSGGHCEDVYIFAHFFQALFVSDAEALLFVDDEKAEILKLDVFRKQPVRADDDVYLSSFEFFEGFLLFFFASEAAEHFDSNGKCGETAAERLIVLKRENGSGRENSGLF